MWASPRHRPQSPSPAGLTAPPPWSTKARVCVGPWHINRIIHFLLDRNKSLDYGPVTLSTFPLSLAGYPRMARQSESIRHWRREM